jgi:hypothetical protein
MTDPKQENMGEDEAALAEDLEIKDGEEADAIKGGASIKLDYKEDD